MAIVLDGLIVRTRWAGGRRWRMGMKSDDRGRRDRFVPIVRADVCLAFDSPRTLGISVARIWPNGDESAFFSIGGWLSRRSTMVGDFRGERIGAAEARGVGTVEFDTAKSEGHEHACSLRHVGAGWHRLVGHAVADGGQSGFASRNPVDADSGTSIAHRPFLWQRGAPQSRSIDRAGSPTLARHSFVARTSSKTKPPSRFGLGGLHFSLSLLSFYASRVRWPTIATARSPGRSGRRLRTARHAAAERDRLDHVGSCNCRDGSSPRCRCIRLAA